MSNPSIVNSYTGSGAMGPGGGVTVDVAVTAPAAGNYVLVFVTAPVGVAISPSLTGVSGWGSIASIASANGVNGSSVLGGLVGAGSGTTLAVAFSGGGTGDAVLVQAVEVTIDDEFVFDGSPTTLAQSVQSGTSFSGLASFPASYAGDLVLAYLSCVSVGEAPSLGAGPTMSFTSVNTEGISGGPNGNLLAQLASYSALAPGSYSTSQGFLQTLSGFQNYCQSIALAIAPLVAPSTVFPATQMRFVPAVGHSNL